MSDVRQLLKDSATQLIRKGGYHSFSFRDLADLAGVKSSSVHYYFPTKSDLGLEVIQDYSASFFKLLEEKIVRAKTPQKRLLCLLDFYESSLQENAGCLCGVLSAELESLSLAERKAISQFFEHIEEWLLTQLKNIDLPHNVKANHYAGLLMSSLSGAILIDRVSGSKKSLDSIQHFLRALV